MHGGGGPRGAEDPAAEAREDPAGSEAVSEVRGGDRATPGTPFLNLSSTESKKNEFF